MTGGTARPGESTRGWPRPRPSTGSRSCSARAGRCSTIPRCCRPTAPPAAPRPPLLLANLGAAQVRGPTARSGRSGSSSCSTPTACRSTSTPCRRRSSPRASPRFSGVLEGIAAIAARLAPRPVVVKEVGFGMDPEDVRLLAGAGVAAVDVAARAARTGR